MEPANGGGVTLSLLGSNPPLFLSVRTLDAQTYLTRETTYATSWVLVNGTIRPRDRADLCVDQQFSGLKNGTKVWLYPCNDTSAQAFLLTGNITAPDNKCLAMGPYGPNNITTSSCNRAAKQIWRWCF
jgi:ricin-type beta-trefoil lectin protein